MSQRKKIAVNTRFLIKDKLEGIGLFTAETLKKMVAAHPEVDFYFLFDRQWDEEFIFGPNVTPVKVWPPARHPFLWYWWFEWSIPSVLNKIKPDLFLSPDGYCSLSTNYPQVMVVHDIAFEHFAGHIPGLAEKYLHYFSPRYCKKATRLVAVSEYTKKDISETYKIESAKIDVTCNAPKEIYKPVTEDVKQRVKAKISGGKDYYIYVGAIHPRKNVKNLLLAFEQFKKQSGSDFGLVIVGRKAWQFEDVDDAYNNMEYKKEVHFLGHLPPNELAEITASAHAMVYVSLFEGFGIPIVEAFKCGVPVITSNTSSMLEVAGGGGLIVNPLDVNEISGAMQQLATDKTLREDLIKSSNLQLEKYTWDHAARLLWNSCETVLKSRA
jgi:glycosyltransferase involved in cell wall biosynthesis